jgi:hypothetical protein
VEEFMKSFFTLTELAVICGVVIPSAAISHAQDNGAKDRDSAVVGTVSGIESATPEEKELLERLTREGILTRDQDTGEVKVKLSALNQLDKLGRLENTESTAGTDTGGFGGY